MSDSENDCDGLEIGSFYFNSIQLWPVAISIEGVYQKPEGRHGEFTIFGFQDIPANLDLYVTDRAWSDSSRSFVPNTVVDEGIVVFTTPEKGLPAGIPFGMGNLTLIEDTGSNWTDVDVSITGINTSQYFNLGQDGDQIFLYCVGSDGRDRPISAFSYGEPFLRNTTSNTVYGTNTSSAPDYFFRDEQQSALNNSDPTSMTSSTPGLLAMRPPEACNGKVYWYWEFDNPCGKNNCITNFYKLRNQLSDAEANWVGSNPDGSFCRSGGSSSLALSSTAAWMSNVFGILLLVWLLVVV